jgi:hypothetical protein
MRHFVALRQAVACLKEALAVDSRRSCLADLADLVQDSCTTSQALLCVIANAVKIVFFRSVQCTKVPSKPTADPALEDL